MRSASKGALSKIARSMASSYLGSELRPTRLRTVLKTIKNTPHSLRDHLYDSLRYLRYSSTFWYGSRDNLASRITATYHAVERGLALPEPRPGFGASNIGYLVEAVHEYIDRHGLDSSLSPSAAALASYLQFNEESGLPDCPHRAEIEGLLRELRPIRGEDGPGGTIRLTREEIMKATEGVTADFFMKRYSIRQFSAREVGAADIDAAIAVAQKAPAVCNRQECHVYVVHDRALIQKMLAIQGTRGFNHQVNKLLVVTNRLTAFYGTEERNQCWIDGGLFAMCLVLGLHARGLGTCCLNWSKSVPPDRAMRELLKIPSPEVIIMLVAVGHLPDELKVARSPRRPLESARHHILDESQLQRPEWGEAQARARARSARA